MYRKTAHLIVLAAALAACGDDPSEPQPEPQPHYELSVTGAMTESATGKAWFGADTDENGQPIFALLLGEDSSRHLVIAGKAGATRPGPGSYAITDPQDSGTNWTVLHIISQGDQLLGMFAATGGTLTITESSADVFEGTLEFNASGMVGETPDSIHVTATFTATPAPAATQLR